MSTVIEQHLFKDIYSMFHPDFYTNVSFFAYTFFFLFLQLLTTQTRLLMALKKGF